MSGSFPESSITLPKRPIERFTAPIQHFMKIEAASGVVLLLATLAALVLANTHLGEGLHHFWSTPVGITIGSWSGKLSLEHLINDGLMAIFFFVIGLEVKREVTVGEFRTMRTALVPIAAALGGMIAPAMIYLLLQSGQPAEAGWGIVMATDIAFVVGCMALLGQRVPHALRVFILMLAIADDIGAVLVIAIGYTTNLSLGWLAVGLLILAIMAVLFRMGLQSLLVLASLAVAVWSCFLLSGVHATVAGVLLGLIVPARPVTSGAVLGSALTTAQEVFQVHAERAGTVVDVTMLKRAVSGAVSPLDRYMHALHPWVSFVIMPLFAFCNAGVPVNLAVLTSAGALAVILGLFLGKPLGIVLSTLALTKSGLAELPPALTLRHLIGGGFLAGIGFTMALFIATLALDPSLLNEAKVGVLAGSLISALVGIAILSRCPRHQTHS
jgi:NhaA family Na+:H+ antiporter